MASTIIYEQPLNERVRVFLKIERLFGQIVHFQTSRSLWDSHAAVSALIEIGTTLERTDLRGEILKELNRQINSLAKLLDTAEIDRVQLHRVLQELTAHVHKIEQLPTKIGANIRDCDLLNSVRQRTLISGGTYGFDIPAYHYWLHQTATVRTDCLSGWLSELHPVRVCVERLLILMRTSTLFERAIATAGFFQRALEAHNPCQLLRIALPTESALYPEVSGNKHRIHVRFLTYTELGRPKQISHDLEFELSCCVM